MATNFTRPTLAALIARVQTDIEGEIAGVTARLRRRFEYGLARAIAGVAHHLHGHLAWVAEQIIVDQASDKYVLRWADFFGVTRKAATAASGNITVTGVGTETLPAGTEFVRLADGARYTVDDEVLTVGTETVAVTAVDAGLAGNMAVGQKLQLASPIVGIDSEATVASGGLTGGTDIETIEALRERTLERIQTPPRGGAPGDHVTWAKEYSGVTQAWEYPKKDVDGTSRAGVVSIAFMTSGGLPDVGMRDDVLHYVQARSPAEVLMIELTEVPLAMTIRMDPDPDDPDNATVVSAVEAQLQDLIERQREPGGTIYLSQLSEAISRAAGELRHVIDSPVADVTVGFDEISSYATPSLNPF